MVAGSEVAGPGSHRTDCPGCRLRPIDCIYMTLIEHSAVDGRDGGFRMLPSPNTRSRFTSGAAGHGCDLRGGAPPAREPAQA